MASPSSAIPPKGNRLQRRQDFASRIPVEDDPQSKKKQEEARKAKEEADLYFSEELVSFSSDRTGYFDIFLKGNYLLGQATVAAAAELFQNPLRKLPVLIAAFDGTTRNLSGRSSEGGQTLHRGAKVMLFDLRLSFINPICNSQESMVPIISHACKYAENHALAKNADGGLKDQTDYYHRPEVTGAFEVADHLFSIMSPMVPRELRTHNQARILMVLSDSDGSTLNSQIFVTRMLYDETRLSHAVIWCGRDKVHMGAIGGREGVGFFIRSAGLSVPAVEKKIYLAAQTAQVKRETIEGELTKILNDKLIATDGEVEVTNETPLRLFRNMVDDIEAGFSLAKADDLAARKITVKRSSYDEVRKAICRQFRGTRLPVWSRWLSTGTSIGQVIVVMCFWLGIICTRLFGDSIQIRDAEVENIFRPAAQDVFRRRKIVFCVMYFSKLILKPDTVDFLENLNAGNSALKNFLLKKKSEAKSESCTRLMVEDMLNILSNTINADLTLRLRELACELAITGVNQKPLNQIKLWD